MNSMNEQRYLYVWTKMNNGKKIHEHNIHKIALIEIEMEIYVDYLATALA